MRNKTIRDEKTNRQEIIILSYLLTDIDGERLEKILEIEESTFFSYKKLFSYVKEKVMKGEKQTIYSSLPSDLIDDYNYVLNYSISFYTDAEFWDAVVSLIEVNKREKLLKKAQKIQSLCYDGIDSEKILSEFISLDMNGDDIKDHSFGSVIISYLNNYYDIHSKIAVTGLRDIDNLIQGYVEGGLYVIGARPGVGKTLFSVNFTNNLLQQDKKVAFFSLEMTKINMAERFFALRSEVNIGKIKFEKSDENKKKIAEGAKNFFKDFSIYDKCFFIEDIELEIRKQKIKGLDVVFIDYLGLIQTRERNENRVLQIGNITRKLKTLANELGICIVILVQLSRGVEGRLDKRPKKEDLRESGSIEQDADCIMLLYQSDERNGFTEVIIDKSRNSSTGSIFVGIDKGKMKIQDTDQARCKANLL